MIEKLRSLLGNPNCLQQLTDLAEQAPASAPLSLRLELGSFDTDWLHLLPSNSPFWYRARPTQQEFRLGIGHALQVISAGANRFAALDNAYKGFCQHWRTPGQALAFTGFAFDSTNNSPLPNALLAIPAILLENIGGHCSATVSTPAANFKFAIAEWLHLLTTPSHIAPATLLPSPAETLADRAWIARVNAALRDITAHRVDKLVLSRQRRIEASHKLSPAHILGQLVKQQPDSVIYGHGNTQHSFIGATPERLVQLNGRTVSADALAGTAWPGSETLTGDKNCHEQSLVVRAVCAALTPLCTAIPDIGPAQIHPAGHLLHLRSKISAQANLGIGIFDLVRALHPTPAVGGFPVTAALDWLAAHHEERAGWYSGGFGILDSKGNGELSVALRSALLTGQCAQLQAGAGIVAGSNPQQELAETEAKLGTLLAALQTHCRADKNGTHN